MPVRERSRVGAENPIPPAQPTSRYLGASPGEWGAAVIASGESYVIRGTEADAVMEEISACVLARC